MKTLKTLTIALTAAALTFCATSAKAGIGITTNYDTVTFSAILSTNADEASGDVLKSQTFVNKNLLSLLTNSDFAGFAFPTGAKLELGWDGSWAGHVLVTDKTGTNVLYDATYNYGEFDVATVVINPWNKTGTFSSKETENGGSLVWYNDGSFELMDQNADIYITGTGPATEHFSDKSVSANLTWTDSQTFSMYGAAETNGISLYPGTLSGKITLSGTGKGEPVYLLETILGGLGL
jgi:hypothetical protein